MPFYPRYDDDEIVEGKGMTEGQIKGLKLVHYTLFELSLGSCTCQTKTPEAEHHDEKCRYRKINQAMDITRDILKDLEK